MVLVFQGAKVLRLQGVWQFCMVAYKLPSYETAFETGEDAKTPQISLNLAPSRSWTSDPPKPHPGETCILFGAASGVRGSNNNSSSNGNGHSCSYNYHYNYDDDNCFSCCHDHHCYHYFMFMAT